MTGSLTILVIFILVYLSMALGKIPGLALDRTGSALLGALALIGLGLVTPQKAIDYQDFSTLFLLFGLMVISAQFRLAGFYGWVVGFLRIKPKEPGSLLFISMAICALMSSLLANDIVCLAMTPIMIQICRNRGFNPLPFLIGLACSSNIGSAATLIGNPQNMLLGQVLKINFGWYSKMAIIPVLAGTLLAFATLFLIYRKNWILWENCQEEELRPLDLWQTFKGLMVLAVLLVFFLFSDHPREIVVLGLSGVILCSRRMKSRDQLGLIDWPLLVLFISLFIVNGALKDSGFLPQILESIQGVGINPQNPTTLFWVTPVLSNLISNVPAVMLLLTWVQDPLSGAILALSSTLAGNFILVGSIANIIVVEQAEKSGVKINFWEHALAGVPITIASLLFTFFFLKFLYF